MGRNALIFHSGGLGDFVLTWPLGLALGRLHPQSRIIYVTQASKGELAAAVLRLEWRDAESSWPALYSDPAGLSEKVIKTVAEAHSVYTFIAAADDPFCGNVRKLAPEASIVPLRVAPPRGYARHVSEYLLEQLALYPAVRGAVEQIMASIRNNGLSRLTPRREPVLIHPGSGSRAKCWPMEWFVEFIGKLKVAGRQVKVLLGEVEMERFSAAEIGWLESAAEVVKPDTYVDLYTALKDAGVFIGHDSGPGHLAAMMGLPVLTLFAAGDPAVWRPMGPKAAVAMNADEVSDAWKQLGQTGI